MRLIYGVLLAAISSFAVATHPAVSQEMVAEAIAKVRDDIVGTITGTVDGEPFVLFALYTDFGDGEVANSATWESQSFGPVTMPMRIDIVGFTRAMRWSEPAITFELWFDENLEPVEIDDWSVQYSTGVMDRFSLDDGELITTDANWTSEGVLSITGSFAGTFVPMIPGRGEPVVIEGVFEFQQIDQETR